MQRPPKLTAAEVKRKLLVILEEGSVIYSWHCHEESMVARNVSAQDVEDLLENGHPSEDAEWSEKDGNWKYKIEGIDIEGDELSAIFVIFDSILTVRVITVF